jgi:hypothetical protein
MRQSMTQSERRDKFEHTHEIATGIIKAQRDARDAKTARLRALRLNVRATATTSPTSARGS